MQQPYSTLQPYTPHPAPRLRWHTMSNDSSQLPGHKHWAMGTVQMFYASHFWRQAHLRLYSKHSTWAQRHVCSPKRLQGTFPDHTHADNHKKRKEKTTPFGVDVMRADNHNRNNINLPMLTIEESQTASAEYGELLTSMGASRSRSGRDGVAVLHLAHVTNIVLDATFLPRLPYDGSGAGTHI